MEYYKHFITIIVLFCYLSVCFAVRRVVMDASSVAGKRGQTVTMEAQIEKEIDTDYVGISWFPNDPTYDEGIILWREIAPAPPGNLDGLLDNDNHFTVATETVENMVVKYTVTIRIPDGMSQAALFESSVRFSILLWPTIKTSAKMVIVGDPACPAPGAYRESTSASMACSVVYMGDPSPNVYWVDYNDQRVGPTEPTVDTENGVVTVTLSRQVQMADHDQDFRCMVEFTDDGVSPAEPTYNDMCATRYSVQIEVRDVRVYPNPDEVIGGVLTVQEGDSLFCNATGSEPITINWYCDGNEDIAGTSDNPQVLTITDRYVRGDTQVDCQCRVANAFLGESYNDVKVVPFYAYEGTGGGEPIGSSGSDTWKIVIGILIPLLIIAAIVGVALYFFKLRKKSEKQPNAENGIPEKPGHENRTFTSSTGSLPAGGKPGKEPVTASNAPAPNYANTPAGAQPNNNKPQYGGMTQQGYPGKGSPGYADLGVKHISGSLPGGLNQSAESLDPNKFYPPVNANPQGGPASPAPQGPPPSTPRTPVGAEPGYGSAV